MAEIENWLLVGGEMGVVDGRWKRRKERWKARSLFRARSRPRRHSPHSRHFFFATSLFFSGPPSCVQTTVFSILDYTRRLLNLLLPPLNTSTLKLHCLLSRRRNQSLDDAPPVCTLARLGRVERGNGVGEVVPCPTQIQPKVSFKREGREGRGGVRCVMRGASFTAPDETRWIAVGCKKRKNEEKEGSARRQESVLTFASAGKMRGSQKETTKDGAGRGRIRKWRKEKESKTHVVTRSVPEAAHELGLLVAKGRDRDLNVGTAHADLDERTRLLHCTHPKGPRRGRFLVSSFERDR